MWKLLVPSLIVSAVAVPLNVVHERRGVSNYQASWKTSSIKREAVVSVRIGLTQRNLEHGYDHVMDVSDPDSENYGKHWTLDQVNAEFAPSDESVNLVTEWLEASGIEHAWQTSNKGWIAFEAPVYQIEELFGARYQEYESQDGVTRIGCEEYSLPQHLTTHIDYITPGVKLSPPVQIATVTKRDPEAGKNHKMFGPMTRPPPKGLWIPPAAAMDLSPDVQNCGVNITPPCYRALYNLPDPRSLKIPSGEIGIFEEGAAYAQDDLNEFFSKFAPYVPNGTTPTLFSINNATAPDVQANAGPESDLDISIAYALLGGVNVSLYQAENPSTFRGAFETTMFDAFLDAIDGSYCSKNETDAGFQCGAYPLSKVLSGSYNTPELFLQSQASQVRTCNEFMKLSLQGHTIVFSSGDYGVATNPIYGLNPGVTNGCIPQDLNNTGLNSYTGTILSPSFPVNCPFCLAAGATQLTANQTVHDAESVMDIPHLGSAGSPPEVHFASGGGFANYFARPSYQDDLVQEYLDNHVPDYPYYESNLVDVQSANTTIGANKGIYNRNGRAIPDVSANGAHGLFVNRGTPAHFFGTSLAAPIWASIITMLNAERAAAGKPSVGFVQPMLYKNPQAFNDITVGSNAGCHTNGFPAVKGWDPSSGLGTPNYAKLSEIFANPQSYRTRK